MIQTDTNTINIEQMLKEDEKSFLTALQRTETTEQAVSETEEEIDRLCRRCAAADAGSDREKESALTMLRVLRSALPLMDSAGEARVWERGTSSDRELLQEKSRAKSARFLSFGVTGLAASVVLSVLLHPLGILFSSMIPAAFSIAGGCFLFAAGRTHKASRREEFPEEAQRIEIRPDVGKIRRYLQGAAIQMDRTLEEVRSEDRLDAESGSSEMVQGWSEEQITLFGDLLEASYSGDGAFALAKLSELRYYLHRCHIELADYTPEHADWFDVMPSDVRETIRPAMLSGGTLLRKGLASEGGVR